MLTDTVSDTLIDVTDSDSGDDIVHTIQWLAENDAYATWFNPLEKNKSPLIADPDKLSTRFGAWLRNAETRLFEHHGSLKKRRSNNDGMCRVRRYRFLHSRACGVGTYLAPLGAGAPVRGKQFRKTTTVKTYRDGL